MMLPANPSNQELVYCFHILLPRDLLVVDCEVLQSFDPIHNLQYKMIAVYF